VARPSLLVGMLLYEQLHLYFLQFYGCIDSCRTIFLRVRIVIEEAWFRCKTFVNWKS
jgi:hypothetical protein